MIKSFADDATRDIFDGIGGRIDSSQRLARSNFQGRDRRVVEIGLVFCAGLLLVQIAARCTPAHMDVLPRIIMLDLGKQDNRSD